MSDEPHPAFYEADRLRTGVQSMRETDDRAHAMRDLTGDDDGTVAIGLIALYHHPNQMDALVLAFLAGMLRERDRHD